MFWWEFGLSSASRNHISTFCRPSIHYACLRFCSAIVHFIRINCLYYIVYLLRLISASADCIGYISNFCSLILLHEHKNSFFNIEAFRNLITSQQGKSKTKNLLDFYTVPSPRGALVGLAPPDKAPIPPKLKYETLQISGIFVKFECQAHLART